MIKVSVVVPVYNVEQYLRRCLDSILGQTFSDYELILVNDGSLDGSPAICDEYARKDARIRVLHKNNGGVSSARNDGVALANGQFVTFVDSDDEVTPDYLFVLYDALERYHADISYVFSFGDGAGWQRSFEINQGKEIVMSGRESIKRGYRAYDDRWINPWGKLIAIDIARRNPFPTDRTFSEDEAVVYTWYDSAEKVVEVQRQIYHYHANSSGVSRQKYGINRLGMVKTYREINEFFQKNNFQEEYEMSLFRYVGHLVWQFGQLSAIQENELAEKIRAELRKTMGENKKVLNLRLTEHPDYYEVAFPVEMWVYWTAKGIFAKIKRIWSKE